MDKVFDHLELIEKDYFGLQFLDLSPDPDTMVGIYRSRSQAQGQGHCSVSMVTCLIFHLKARVM